jgi:hypothetical protein
MQPEESSLLQETVALEMVFPHWDWVHVTGVGMQTSENDAAFVPGAFGFMPLLQVVSLPLLLISQVLAVQPLSTLTVTLLVPVETPLAFQHSRS